MRMSGRVRVATLRSYLRPRLEAILELVDCVGRRTAAEELRRSSRLPGTQSGRALRTVSAPEAPNGTRFLRRSCWSNNNGESAGVPGSANKRTRWKERSSDAVGGWSPGQSQGHVRTARKRISVMQCHVAKLLRNCWETDLEKTFPSVCCSVRFR